jgi:two-component system alkaline phosphatase synthesis response regulator PhoP
VATILVVDDELDLVEMLKIKLKRAGYHVLTAVNGSEALATLAAEIPNLIILDAMLPPPDGYKVCRIIKSNQRYQNVPVLMLSAKGMREDVARGYEAGADYYITKPIKPTDLVKKIQGILNK